MSSSRTYPNADIERTAESRAFPHALISYVAPDSPADDAGFTPGCFVTAVDGQPVRDIIDWRWLTSDDVVTLSYIDTDGDAGEVELEREWGEDWGIEFDGLVFDGVKQCRNACTFCFMHQLPKGMRKSLSLRDDDFRLSFLVGTFVTLTNITPADEQRIIEQRISPLRVSLQVSNEDVRRRMIGKHAGHGLEVLDRLLAAGIEFHAQIVLVPDANDGDVLAETLGWAYERPGILNVGIVPLGYTRHQSRFDHSFNEPPAAHAVLDAIAPFQQRARAERGTPWVFAADEFYSNAWGDALLEHLPPSEHYGDFALFEDGIGIIRSTVDDWEEAKRAGIIARCATMLRSANVKARMIAGCAQKEFLTPLVEQSAIGDVFEPLYVPNDFFGGNVDVTGLLTAQDILSTLASEEERQRATPENNSNDHSGSRAAAGAGKRRECCADRPQESRNSSNDHSGSRAVAGAGKRSECCADRSQEPEDASNDYPGSGVRPDAGKRSECCADRPQIFKHIVDQAYERSFPASGQTREPAARQRGAIPQFAAPAPEPARSLYLVPRVVFNDDGVTLDDMTLDDVEKAAGQRLHMVSCSPIEYFKEIAELVELGC